MLRIFYIIMLSSLCTGCNKWLEVLPKTTVPENAFLIDEQGFKDALIGVYVSMGNQSLYAKESTMGFIDVLAQNYNVVSNTHTYYQAGQYNYLDVSVRPKIDGLWRSAYSAIANLNNLLEVIDAKKGVFKNNNYEQIKGEALALRALIHFDLLRIFGPIPSIGMQTEAIPYVMEFKMNVVPNSTSEQVLNACLRDLKQAIILLSQNKAVNYSVDDPFLSHTRNHMNYWATAGLMARIYLYKGDKENAYEKAKEVIDAKMFPFVTASSVSNSAGANYIFSTEILFGLYISNLKDINTILFSSSSSTSLLSNSEAFRNQRYEVATGGSTDFRYLYLWGTEGASATKYPIKFLQNANMGINVINRVPVIRLSEMYYIAAETSKTLEDRIGLINTVRANRGLKALPATSTEASMEEEIFKEYKKEFYQEGQLFYYYKRKNRDKIEGVSRTIDASVYVLPKPDDEIEFSTSN